MKINQTGFFFASALGLAGATCLSSAAFASGFGLREGTADWLGDAFAGDSAKAYDASTVWTNPAGMVRLDQNEIDNAINYIGPSFSFTGTNNNPNTHGNVSGTVGGNDISAAATGSAFGVLVLSPDFRLGFSLTAPYGARVSYPGDFVGRYQSLVSNITDINFGLALSYKVNDHLSIGGGPNIDYFDARLTQALNVPVLSALTGQDPIADTHGNSLGVGYNVGILYQFDDSTRLGIDYRSRIRHNISGEQKITVPAIFSLVSPEAAAELNAASSAATTSITLPDNLDIGLYHQITQRWAVMGNIEWTDWSLFNSLNVTPTNGAPGTTVQENWRNAWFAGIGTNYWLLDNLMLQTGFSYDESPVTNSNRTTRIPDSDHYNLGFGAQYQILPSTSLQVAYLHVFSPGGTINNTASNAPTSPSGAIMGSYTFSDNSVSAGFTVKF
jgi:long-chain fatty acid transport protein